MWSVYLCDVFTCAQECRRKVENEKEKKERDALIPATLMCSHTPHHGIPPQEYTRQKAHTNHPELVSVSLGPPTWQWELLTRTNLIFFTVQFANEIFQNIHLWNSCFSPSHLSFFHWLAHYFFKPPPPPPKGNALVLLDTAIKVNKSFFWLQRNEDLHFYLPNQIGERFVVVVVFPLSSGGVSAFNLAAPCPSWWCPSQRVSEVPGVHKSTDVSMTERTLTNTEMCTLNSNCFKDA